MKKLYTPILLFISLHSSAQFVLDTTIISNYTRAASTDKIYKVLSYDLNSDGKKDIIIDGGMYNNQSGMVVATSSAIILLGNGDGSFGSQTYFTKPSTLHAISDFGDYNNDGKPDMLVYGFWQNGFSLYTGGVGTMNFSNIQNFNAGTHGYEAKFLDYDKDGDLDILTITSGSAADVLLHVYTNTNNNFAHTSYSLNNNQFFPHYEFVDVDKNGFVDVVANGEGQLNILYQDSNHVFRNTIQDLYSSPFFAWEDYFLACKDYNNDGRIDIVAARNNNLYFVKGKPGSPYLDILNIDNQINPFDLHLNPNSQFYSYDMDNDGFMDIVSYTGTYSGVADDAVNIYYDPFNFNNKRSVTAIPLNAECINMSLHALLFDDYNQDGKMDILALGMDDKIRVMLNKADAAPPPPPPSTGIQIFPIPATHHITIKNADNIGLFKIYDGIGREMVSQINSAASTVNINIEKFARGVYILVGYTNGKRVLSHKIIKG
jgi:hypothetical protein